MRDGSEKRTTGFTYAVKYVLGGSEKRVDAQHISKSVDNGGRRSSSPRASEESALPPKKRRSAEKLNKEPPKKRPPPPKTEPPKKKPAPPKPSDDVERRARAVRRHRSASGVPVSSWAALSWVEAVFF